MILEQLLEKKDILAYIELRISILHQLQEKYLKEVDEEERQYLVERVKGRIAELLQLRKHIHELKDMSKKYWRDCAKYDDYEQNNM